MIVSGIITLIGYINNDPYVRDLVHWAIIIGIPLIVAFSLVFTPLLWIAGIFFVAALISDGLRKLLERIHGLGR